MEHTNCISKTGRSWLHMYQSAQKIGASKYRVFFSAMCCLISRMERFQVRNSKRALKNQQKANHLPIYLLLSNFSLTHNSEQLTLTVRIELNIFHDYWLVVLKKKEIPSSWLMNFLFLLLILLMLHQIHSFDFFKTTYRNSWNDIWMSILKA